MKSLNEIKQDFFAVLCELQNTTPQDSLKNYLLIKLEILLDILNDEISAEYQQQAIKIIYYN